ncbi:MAG: sigma-70 family RNA polymerase sigma factor [Planctomycetia bacterium]|nr:sigma-70 family RNA polymerase sigma factor [Planctomycetia bacterium]
MTESAKSNDRLQAGGSTSRSLLADARLADPEAWERLSRLYAPLVAFWCRRWGVPDQDIVDLLQEVFAAVAGHLARFRKERPEDTFRGWLLTIARNKTRDYLRRRSEEPAGAGGTEASLRMQQVLDPHADELKSDDADDAIFDAVLRNALDAIRGDFHEQTWRAFWGVVVEGRATADVAADLGMRPGTVRVAKSRVLLRLRLELGDARE